MSAIEKWTNLCNFQYQVKNELQATLKPLDLDLNEYFVLYWLNKEADKTLRFNELETKIDLSQSALSRMIGRMRAKDCGAIEQIVCADDKRGRYLKLTALGKTKLEQAQKVVDEVLTESFKQGGLN